MLPVLGTVYYNGFFFPGAITAHVDAVPVYDSTNRFVKWRNHNITIECILYPGADDRVTTDPGTGGQYVPKFPGSGVTSDDGFRDLRHRLTEPGGLLIFNFQGYGDDVSVSGSGTASGIHRDVDYGPKPKLLAWEPLGGPKGIRIVWQCTFALAECDTGDFSRKTRELSYGITWSIDDMGATVRAISGFVEVVVRKDGNRIQSVAEQWKDRLSFAVPAQFKRESQTYELSPDRSRLEFQIVDREIISDNPYQKDCVEMEVNESVRPGRRGVASQVWMLTIEGTITVALNKPRYSAWVAFLQIVKSRRALARQFARANNATTDKSTSSASTRSSDVMRTLDLQISEELYGRSMSFSVTWELYCNLGTLLQACGFWQPVPGQAWGLWASSMAPTWGPRGAAQLKTTTSDYVISMCEDRTPVPLSESSLRITPAPNYSVFESECPTAENSWLYFKPMCHVIKDTYTSSQYPLGARTTQTSSKYELESTGSGHDEQTSNAKPPVIQLRGEYRYRVIFSGLAERIGHEIPQPKLLTYGGANATPIGELHFRQTQDARNLDGCIVYRAQWKQTYALDKKPNGPNYSINPDYRSIIK